MKKNNIILFLLMALPTLLLTSCLKDQEDLFPDSASARTVKYLENAQKVLMSSEKGWLLNYYPDRDQSYGGCAYVLKFGEDKVEVASELADDVAETLTTTYIMKNEDGPVLMFDTYNDYMHYFATPSGSSGAGGYEAYDGDFIFIIMDISEDQNTITLKGSRSGNIMYMHRMTSTASEYLQKVLEIEELMPVNYKFMKDTMEVKVKMSDGRVSFTSDTLDLETAYIYTDDGIEFYEPIEIGSDIIKGIMYVGEEEQVPAKGCDIVMAPVFLPVNDVLVNNIWYLAYSKIGPFGQPYFDVAKAGSASEGEVIGVLAFRQVNGFSLYFQSGRYAGALAFDTEFIGEDQIKLTYNAPNNYSNADWYYKNAGYNYLTVPLENTFKLEADSKVKASVIKMTDINNPDNYFIVTTAPVSNPFSN